MSIARLKDSRSICKISCNSTLAINDLKMKLRKQCLSQEHQIEKSKGKKNPLRNKFDKGQGKPILETRKCENLRNLNNCKHIPCSWIKRPTVV